MQQQHKTGTRKVLIKLTDTQEQPKVGEFQERLQSHMEEFAEHLDTARTIWQRYPEFVEAPEFPEPFLRAFHDRNGNEKPGFASLSDELLVKNGLLKSGKADELLQEPEAAEPALKWRFNKPAVDEQIRTALADGFDQLARGFAEDASVQEMGLLTALLNNGRGGRVLELLNELLCSAEEPKA